MAKRSCKKGGAAGTGATPKKLKDQYGGCGCAAATPKPNNQSGGMAPACLKNPDVSKYTNPCKGANIHNTNQIGGGCGCNKNKKNMNQYKLNLPGMVQSAGGVSVNVEEMIAGQPRYDSYDDCCQPALVGGKLVSGAASGSQPACGAQYGGKKHTKSKKSKKSKKPKGNKKGKGKGKKRTKKQKGGQKSKPSEFPFKGENSNFSQDMKEHTFDETQPDYSVNAI